MNAVQQPTEDAFECLAPLLLGITGKRNVGKTTVADYLCDEYGFVKVHAYGGGKIAAQAFFEHITNSATIAHNMVNGWLKDMPSEYLPNNATPRSYLEKTGEFAGTVLGVEWTLGLEVERARRLYPGKRIVVESLVYEVDWFKQQGGVVLRLERYDFDSPVGESSDAFQAKIEEDYKIESAGVMMMLDKVDELLETLGVVN